MGETQIDKLRNLLFHYWGFKSFRPAQISIIKSIVSGKDTIGIMPTGGGKSMCYQIPALYFEGVTIVISPLIALMNDQVEGLRKLKIKAAALHGGCSPRQQDIILDNAIYGGTKLLYISPERIRTKLFLTRFEKMQVSLLAIDEAHCISQWGHDFRPAYRNISLLREQKKKVPIIALSATATPLVVKDIATSLDLKDSEQFIYSPLRNNLAYHVINTEDKYSKLVSFLKHSTGSNIVYVRNRRKTKELVDFLANRGLDALPYHGGMEMKERTKNQELWLQDKIKTIVATNAFGMGIDKSNVREVIHMDVVSSLEEYVQEAGRAGRDGRFSNARVIFYSSDLEDKKKEINRSFPDLETIKKVFKAICVHYQIAINDVMEKDAPLDLKHIAQKAEVKIYAAYFAVKILDAAGVIKLSDAMYNPSRLLLFENNVKAYPHSIDFEKPIGELIRSLLRQYEGLFFDATKIDESVIAAKANLKKEEVVELLQKAHKIGLVEYTYQSQGLHISVTRPRPHTQNLEIPSSVYAEKKSRMDQKLDVMIDYLNTSRCRQQIICDYFGFTDEKKCEKCDYCLQNFDQSMIDINFLKNKFLSEIGKEGKELKRYLSGIPPEEYELSLAIISELENEKILSIKNGKVYKL